MDLFPARGGVVRRFLTRLTAIILISYFCFFSFGMYRTALPFGSLVSPAPVFAQTNTPVPPTPTATPPGGGLGTFNPQSNVWAKSPEVTEVGRNADRARQLLWWVWTHPGIYHAPIIAQLWGVTRNIVYVFIVLVLIAFGIGIMLGRRRGMPGPTFSGITSPLFGMQVPQVFMKLGMILLYVTFSYVIVLGLIQFSEVSMQFIKSLVGRDLFNVFFAGTGNIEANYTTFIGYYNTDDLALEMVNTSMFVIRLTSFTYYTMAIILILRTVILWFLLILSPFLAILMPFVFIRNTGWIWIGVFFQWLFYGPMMTLFVVALVNIWVAGIPYPFDFGRVNKPEGQVYKTSINILYGGPAQTLSSGNSANYVDTFAEYVIALVMLWTAMILPWLLLRIFRDYCCSLLASANSTMSAIFDRLRQYPPPAPPPPPSPTKSGMAAQLPFRQSISENAPESKYISSARMREISKASTSEIARAMDLSVISLKDVSRLEIREKDRQEVRSTLERLAAPERISSVVERERYETVKSELVERARGGDKMAQSVLMASSERRTEVLAKQVAQIHAQKAFAPSVSRQTRSASTQALRSALMDRKTIEHVASNTNVSASQVESVLREATKSAGVTQQQMRSIAQQNNVSEEKVRDILAVSSAQTSREAVSSIAKSANVAEEQVQNVIERAMTSKLMTQSQVQSIAQQANMSAEKVQEIVTAHNATQSAVSTLSNEIAVKEIANTTNTTHEKVREVLSAISEKGSVSTQAVKEIAASTSVSESAVSSIISAATTKQTAQATMSSESAVSEIAKTADVSRDAVHDVLTAVSKSGVVTAQTIKDVAQQTNLSEQKVATIVESSKQATVTATAPSVAVSASVPAIAEKVGVTEDKVQQVIKEMSAAVPGAESMKAVAEKVGMPEAKVQEIMAASQQQAAVPAAVPVSIEEYEDVKKMWLSHYRDAPVPVSDTIKDRESWVSDEEKKLTNILNLLTSTQPEMKQKGLEQVAEILPFMLLGGFSESETVGYIQAKLAATQQIKTEIVMKKQIAAEMGTKIREEEETLVEVGGRQTQQQVATQSQTRTVEMPAGMSTNERESLQRDVKETVKEALERTTQEMTRASVTAIQDATKKSLSEVTQTMRSMVTSLKELSRLEIDDQTRHAVQSTLESIASPQRSTVPEDRQRYEQLHTELVDRSSKGDALAQVMLMTGEKQQAALIARAVSQQPIANSVAASVGVSAEAVQTVLQSVHRVPAAKLVKGEIVADIFKGESTESTSLEQTTKALASKAGIPEGKVKDVLTTATAGVSIDDYEEVKKMWIEHYRNSPVPTSDTIKSRHDWLAAEEKKLTNVLNLIVSFNPDLRQQGMSEVAELLPFLLLGGFSDTEMTMYLRAKLEAAQQVKEEIEKIEQAKQLAEGQKEDVLVSAAKPKGSAEQYPPKEEHAKEQKAEVKKENSE